MSEKIAKKIRKAARKAADKRFMAMVRQIGELPFTQRMRFALKIVRGARHARA